jgi:hypothetical protein
MIYIEVSDFWKALTISFVDFTMAPDHFAAMLSASARRNLQQWRRL